MTAELFLTWAEAMSGLSLVVAAIRHFNAPGCVLPPWVDGIWAALGTAGATVLVALGGLPIDTRWPMAVGLLAAGVLASLDRRRDDIRRFRGQRKACRDCLKRQRVRGPR